MLFCLHDYENEAVESYSVCFPKIKTRKKEVHEDKETVLQRRDKEIV